ncbi:hypothetical protein SSIG_08014 [Streptomyces filamentosus NRRL 11379]|uniref:Predicted protein n=1 Tax=Streptomyces filamentosus NRRL 15998 TaxID=457431 RepID=D6AHV0_STRFL|nr:predicted protein [Streptomyces filamentosus NRRL 15998]EWS94022.1 hypothetical protein SSIG_08014 [Streptomyces filamentosus NRRL 11379]
MTGAVPARWTGRYGGSSRARRGGAAGKAVPAVGPRRRRPWEPAREPGMTES